METAEDYVEAVYHISSRSGKCRLVDVASHFQVASPTASKIIARLEKEGLVTTQPYGPIGLTTEGLKLAKKAEKRHATVVNFLKAIGVSDVQAEIDAEGIEHHVSPETLRCMIDHLTHPKRCQD